MIRRTAVFEYYTCRKLSPKKIVEILEKRGISGCSLPNIRRDIHTMSKWLPEIVKMKADSTLITAEVLGKMQVTQQRILNLAETADNSNAQVSALRASVDAINSEEDFRFKTGQIAAVPQRIEVKSDVSEDEFSRFIPVIVDMVMGEQVRKTKQGDDEAGPKEPLDPSHPKQS
jgi:hypothetical protein